MHNQIQSAAVVPVAARRVCGVIVRSPRALLVDADRKGDAVRVVVFPCFRSSGFVGGESFTDVVDAVQVAGVDVGLLKWIDDNPQIAVVNSSGD